jgi:TRAP-type uncharacterized transport system fused permease subunit
MSTINAQAGNSTAFSAIIKVSDGTANLALQTNGSNAVVIDQSQIANFTSTGAVTIPAGTTNNRPTGVNGMIRYNTSTANLEAYVSGVWITFP